MLKRRSSDREGTNDQRSSRPKKRRPLQRADTMKSQTAYTTSVANILAGLLAISECVVCRKCGGDGKFLIAGTRGLGFKLKIVFSARGDTIKSGFSFPLVNSAYEINRCFTFVIRLLRNGLKAMQLFWGVMDLASCIAQTTFYANMKNVKEASSAVATQSMKVAAEEELRQSANQDTEKEGIQYETGMED